LAIIAVATAVMTSFDSASEAFAVSKTLLTIKAAWYFSWNFANCWTRFSEVFSASFIAASRSSVDPRLFNSFCCSKC
jgi:hypothetical protein